MKKCGFLILSLFVLSFVPAWGQVFTPYRVDKIPGAYYFTPAAFSGGFAVFGYMSKITPEPAELEAEKRRISAIIDDSVRKNYGSWQDMDRAMKEVGQKASREMEARSPGWSKGLLPPSFLRQALPFFLKGALFYAKTYPEAMREPVGNVGETGILVVDQWGTVTKVPLGINAPVRSISISEDGRVAAVLTDMSFEDENGNLCPIGEISLIDLMARKRTRSWIFANLAETVTFTPLSNVIAFDCYTDMQRFSKRQLRFMDLKKGAVLKYRFTFCTPGSGKILGKNVRFKGFLFHEKEPLVALYKGGAKYEIRQILTNRQIFLIRSGQPFVFARMHPWVFTSLGELWDIKGSRLLDTIRLRGGNSFLYQATFSSTDQQLFCYKSGRLLRIELDVKTGGVKRMRTSRKRGGLFFLVPGDEYLVSFVPGRGLVSYKGRYLRRQRLCLRIFKGKDLEMAQDICMDKDSTVIDAAMAGNSLVVSDFDSLHIFTGPFVRTSEDQSNIPGPKESMLARIDANPHWFAGRVVELDGWAWGWMAKPPKEVARLKLAFARHNYGSKMDGTFTDGTIRILYPVPVTFSGPLHIKAMVKITPSGWQLVPVR